MAIPLDKFWTPDDGTGRLQNGVFTFIDPVTGLHYPSVGDEYGTFDVSGPRQAYKFTQNYDFSEPNSAGKLAYNRTWLSIESSLAWAALKANNYYGPKLTHPYFLKPVLRHSVTPRQPWAPVTPAPMVPLSAPFPRVMTKIFSASGVWVAMFIPGIAGYHYMLWVVKDANSDMGFLSSNWGGIYLDGQKASPLTPDQHALLIALPDLRHTGYNPEVQNGIFNDIYVPVYQGKVPLSKDGYHALGWVFRPSTPTLISYFFRNITANDKAAWGQSSIVSVMEAMAGIWLVILGARAVNPTIENFQAAAYPIVVFDSDLPWGKPLDPSMVQHGDIMVLDAASVNQGGPGIPPPPGDDPMDLDDGVSPFFMELAIAGFAASLAIQAWST